MNTIHRFRRGWIVLIFLPIASLLFIFSFERNVKSRSELEYDTTPIALEQSDTNYATSLDDLLRNENDARIPNCINPEVSENEKTSIALLKVHKTGSTTFSSILYRYGIHRGLSFVMPENPDLHQFFPNTIDQARNLYPPCIDRYDILNIHSRYNGRKILTKYMHENTFVIATLRHPVDQMVSGFKYYGYSKQLEAMNVSLSDFLTTPGRYAPLMKNGVNPMDLMWNGMSNDIGLSEFNIPKGLSRSQLQGDPMHMQNVEKFLDWVETEIDFFVISEEFDESLILLKDLLNWNLEDLMYFSQNAAANKVSDVDEELRDKLIEFSYIDYLLYEKMLKKFLELKNEKGAGFQEEVLELQRLNSEYSEFCLEKRQIDPKLYGSVPILGNTLRAERKSDRCCSDTAIDEWSYVKMIKKYMQNSCTFQVESDFVRV